MNQLINAVDKILGLIPFNGDKTVIGAGLKLLIPIAVVKMPLLLVVAPVVDATANLLMAIGLAHKAVKASAKKPE